MHRRERSTGGSNTNASASAASNTASNSNSSPGNTSPTKRQLGPSSSVPLSPSKYGSLPRSFTRAVARVSSGIGAAEVRDGTAVGSGPTAKSSDSLSGALMGAFKASAGRQTDSGVVILGPFAESGFDVADCMPSFSPAEAALA